MMAGEGGGGRRFLVPFDTRHHVREVFSEAVELAACLEAEVEGLFIEDDELFRLAALPIARQITLPTAQPSPFNPMEIKREMRSIAERAKTFLSHQAGIYQIAWSFRTVKNRHSEEGGFLKEEAAFVLFGAAHTTPLRERAAPRQSGVRGPVLAVSGKAEDMSPALAVAKALSAAGNRDMALHRIASLEDIKAIVAACSASIVVISANSGLLKDPQATRIIARSPYPVLLVR